MPNHPLLLAGLSLLALAACHKAQTAAGQPASQPAPAQPAARFCDQNLSGVWVNASDHRYAYRFRDENGGLRGEYLTRLEDGGLQAPPEPVLFELQRKPDSLAGVMKAKGPSLSGRVCPVDFAIRVSSCEPDAMSAVVETEAPVNDECARITRDADGGAVAPALTEFRFERLHPSGG